MITWNHPHVSQGTHQKGASPFFDDNSVCWCIVIKFVFLLNLCSCFYLHIIRTSPRHHCNDCKGNYVTIPKCPWSIIVQNLWIMVRYPNVSFTTPSHGVRIYRAPVSHLSVEDAKQITEETWENYICDQKQKDCKNKRTSLFDEFTSVLLKHNVYKYTPKISSPFFFA